MEIDELLASFAPIAPQPIAMLRVSFTEDSKPILVWCNEAYGKQTGYAIEDLVDKPLDQLFGEETDDESVSHLLSDFSIGNTALHSLILYHESGRKFWAELNFTPISEVSDNAQHWVLFQRDITSIKYREDAAVRAVEMRTYLSETLKSYKEKATYSEKRLWNAIEALPQAFVIYDKEDRLVMCNEQYRETYKEIADVIEPGAKFEYIIRTAVERGAYPEAKGREEEWIQNRVYQHQNPRGSIEQVLPGNRYLKIHEQRTSDGDIVGFRVDITDIKRQQWRLEKFTNALERAKTRIQEQALHDPLTNLANRRRLDDFLQQCAKRCANEGVELALLHVDLDRFKQVNDTLGHAAGDHVLVSVANSLRVCTDKQMVARIGGDEFVIVCIGNDVTDEANKIAEKVVEELSKPINFEGRPCRIGASVGIACANGTNVNGSELLTKADVALYQAKRNGRSQAVHFSKDLQTILSENNQTKDDLLGALERKEFVPFFQPQFAAKTLDLVGVETLARWQHPTRGMLVPFHFLGVAEELDVVGKIDSILFQKSMEMCRRMEDSQIELPKVSVNVSYRRLADPHLIDSIKHADEIKTKVAFELLETIFLDDQTDDIQWNIDRLKERGIEIEIDDFGSGRASIVALTKVGPSVLKIDRELVMPITESQTQRSLVEAIIQMGRSLGISVTAEGVETMEHAKILADLGCDTLQGYAFAQPMSETDLVEFLQNEPWRNAA